MRAGGPPVTGDTDPCDALVGPFYDEPAIRELFKGEVPWADLVVTTAADGECLFPAFQFDGGVPRAPRRRDHRDPPSTARRVRCGAMAEYENRCVPRTERRGNAARRRAPRGAHSGTWGYQPVGELTCEALRVRLRSWA